MSPHVPHFGFGSPLAVSDDHGEDHDGGFAGKLVQGYVSYLPFIYV